MKKIKKTTVFIMTLILSLLVIPIAGQKVYAAGGNISSLPVSIKAYPVSTANNTPAFANKGDGNKSGTIYAADLCTITRIDGDGWLIVNYPTSNNRTRTLFVKARDFFCATSFQEASISKYATAYRRSSGSESIGSVDAADRLVYVIGSSQNGRFQIVYRVTNSTYYKMGWVSADALSKTPSNQPSLTFSPSSVTLTEGTNGTVNVKFSGDGLKTLNVESSNTSVCTAYWSGTTDWKAGTSTLTVKGKKAGSANITVSFLNNSGKKFYSKSFSVTVKAKSTPSSLTFSPSSVTLTEGTNGTVNIKFSGNGIKTLNVASSNTSVCTAYWSGTTDWKAGTSTLTVKGKKAGSANITVSFMNNSGTKFYSKSFSVTVNDDNFIKETDLQTAASNYSIDTNSNAYEALKLINTKYASQLSASQKQGTIVLMFEGVGTSSSTSKRENAMCVVVKNGRIVYINCSSSSLPDYPFTPSKNGGDPMPTLKSGIYTFTTVNHRQQYAALHVSDASVVRFRSSNSWYSDTSPAINIHRKSSDSIAGANQSWVNSAGCQLVGRTGISKSSDYAKFIQSVGIVNANAAGNVGYTYSVTGIYIVDRSYAYQYMRNIGYSDAAIHAIG